MEKKKRNKRTGGEKKRTRDPELEQVIDGIRGEKERNWRSYGSCSLLLGMIVGMNSGPPKKERCVCEKKKNRRISFFFSQDLPSIPSIEERRMHLPALLLFSPSLTSLLGREEEAET